MGSPLLDQAVDSRADGFDGGLEPIKVAQWLEANNAAAMWTTVAAQ